MVQVLTDCQLAWFGPPGRSGDLRYGRLESLRYGGGLSALRQPSDHWGRDSWAVGPGWYGIGPSALGKAGSVAAWRGSDRLRLDGVSPYRCCFASTGYA